ncbi:MAG TPA: aminodeoxychorismate/anthranilate synthase component II [Oligoflexia bacterium]|nr:aminodeoxychorismate/anthranilate synthase component II [Oligoflexia bacterium]HMP48177.1 aminodeoxychorismate/anthranilate synthase component II [Oligoflexia bacterium]
MSKNILVLDNYDSFTYNLVHMLKALSGEQVVVARNDEIDISEVENYDHIVLSPGPGIPVEAGIMFDLVRRYSPSRKILGVCLGHQCIGEAFGGTLNNLPKVFHGKAIETEVVDSKESLFLGLPPRFMTGRYHSWVVSREGFPNCLKVTAVDDEGEIMALRHVEYNVVGVQFHPESVLTPHGEKIISNWLNSD